MNSDILRERIESGVDNGVIPALMDFIRVPNLSPAFDKEWETNGLMLSAIDVVLNYVKSLNIQGFNYELLKEPGKPWLFFGEFPATAPNLGTVLMYGHFDKQPHIPGWIEGTDNTHPAIINGRLYGRGGVDDGYSFPSTGLIIKTLDELGIPRGRITFIGETEEESGSSNLMGYILKVKDRIGDPDLIICLDAGIPTYDRFWLTGSLRGLVTLDVTVKVLIVGQHSGDVSGVVPSSFRIFRQLLDRIEDSRTGQILIPELYAEITPEIYENAARCAVAVGKDLTGKVNWEKDMKPVSSDPVQIILNRTYRPTLSILGCRGIPSLENAGNLLRPSTSLRLSVRLPPTVDCDLAAEKLVEALTRDPPYGASIEIKRPIDRGKGWKQNGLKPWLRQALDSAGHNFFGTDCLFYNRGGSIPFLNLLGDEFPSAQFMVAGPASTDSNTHSANENFRIDYMKKILCCVSEVLYHHGRQVKTT